MNSNCVVLGAGGHARVLIECIIASGNSRPVLVLDEDASAWGQEILEVKIEGGDDLLPQMRARGITDFAVGVGSVGSSRHRAQLFAKAVACGLNPLMVKHPSAICSRWAEVGRGTQLFPGSVVNAGARLGENVIINTSAVVEHDSIIEAHAHIATGAKLSGNVHVGSGAHVGVGAAIRQGISIGDHSIVGAGAVVVKDVPAGIIVVGTPARLLRSIDPEDERNARP